VPTAPATPATHPSPSADHQLQFLRDFQRILEQGSFSSTYKFALLHALADLAVRHGDGSGVPLTLTTRDIAQRIIELYWPQAAPFPLTGSRPALVLRQNAGQGQAEILRHLDAAKRHHGPSLERLRRDLPGWGLLLGNVDAVVRKMPLWRLQTVGAELVDFLYENAGRGTTITLRPRAAACLTALHGILTALVRDAWLRFVRRSNLAALDEAADLDAFLFGSPRASLERHRPLLQELQSNQCFYCQRRLVTAADVDHFVPWARYAVDLGHNFVLAHPACNRSKSEHLAAERHLAAWVARNHRYRDQLAASFDNAGVLHDLDASLRVAAWAYDHVQHTRGQVWLAGGRFERLSPAWRSILVA